MVTSELDCIHLHVVEIVPKNYITPMTTRKLGWSICMWCKLDLETTSTLHRQQKILVEYIFMCCKLDLKIVLAPHGNKGVGWIHLYVVQISPEICINTLWQQQNKDASICMWCKLDLKNYIRALKGLVNFDNFWKEKKIWKEGRTFEKY